LGPPSTLTDLKKFAAPNFLTPLLAFMAVFNHEGCYRNEESLQG